ncbi:hypothetical protein [Leisingera sp. JC11]
MAIFLSDGVEASKGSSSARMQLIRDGCYDIYFVASTGDGGTAALLTNS